MYLRAQENMHIYACFKRYVLCLFLAKDLIYKISIKKDDQLFLMLLLTSTEHKAKKLLMVEDSY